MPISFSQYLLDPCYGLTTINPCLLALLFLLLGADPGLFEEHRCWWNWCGDCAKCSSPVLEIEGLFCVYFLEPRAGWAPCQICWHAKCYKCMGKGQIPTKMHQDAQGNPWFKQKMREDEINRGVSGAHASVAFQCKRCWFLNMEGCLPHTGCDDMYLKLIHQANLDAIGGRAVTTSKAHTAAISRMVCNCALIRKIPTIPARGPCKLKDCVGMSIAIDMFYSSLVSIPRLQGESHIQFKSMRYIQATYTCLWVSSPQGIAKGGSFSLGFGRTTMTAYPTKQEWFLHFLRGCEIRMGYTTKSN